MEESLTNIPETKSYEPEVLLNYIDKYVTVLLIKNTTFCGFCQAIDPETNSVILSVPTGDTYETVVIPGHAVLDISECVTDLKFKLPTVVKKELDFEEISNKKNRILAWLKYNMLPVSESGNNILFGNVSILPPYTSRDICADSSVITLQIKSILERMPDDFVAK